ncbi:dormancy-associated protein 2-like isoform X3 [Diaphorina citri]|uniref:Dormancy-associated protein 2-like isoform X1 n=1 Tax=Diaphorina citri TaxID=121845 RepID=A0A1S3DC73_DIACI|nr:dormancy-associated protein 2-like isoform X1 [Diaphorina citri]XP_008479003.1 dormancy-associated protein 2-like isoform X2 [Diaphorina citri]XP_026684218.1 dormancy-associated protein 2-like isoform X3 [Diaphorina citri]KAI5696230.1 hypothetical protein M8J75_010089 [Diaphorina citri]KAI5722785.1 hypothetical protein M8J76_013574 [Diaphorina citri]KAI5725746.1 hypothetical protein M8J77_019627 [Diaphorina citri]
MKNFILVLVLMAIVCLASVFGTPVKGDPAENVRPVRSADPSKGKGGGYYKGGGGGGYYKGGGGGYKGGYKGGKGHHG